MKEKKYTSITIKVELKELMDEKIEELGIEMSYSSLIRYLIKNNSELNKKNK